MVNDNDTDLDDNAEEEVPFGGWASAKPKNADDGGPKAVVSTADGTQRAAGQDELSMPKYQGGQENALPQGVKSFSATFGLTPNSGPTGLPPVEDDDDDTAPPPQNATTDETQSEAQYDTALLSGEDVLKHLQSGEEPPMAESSAPASEHDPFAWNPEEAPSAEPRAERRSFDDSASWMAPTSDYEELKASVAEANRPAVPVEEQEVQPTINPYTFGKEEEWEAPPMFAGEEETPPAQGAPEPLQQPAATQEAPATEAQDTTAHSPFDFAGYEQPVAGDDGKTAPPPQPEVTDPFLPADTPQQPDIVPDMDSSAPAAAEVQEPVATPLISESLPEFTPEEPATQEPQATLPETEVTSPFDLPPAASEQAAAEEPDTQMPEAVVSPFDLPAEMPAEEAEPLSAQTAEAPKTTFMAYRPASAPTEPEAAAPDATAEAQLEDFLPEQQPEMAAADSPADSALSTPPVDMPLAEDMAAQPKMDSDTQQNAWIPDTNAENDPIAETGLSEQADPAAQAQAWQTPQAEEAEPAMQEPIASEWPATSLPQTEPGSAWSDTPATEEMAAPFALHEQPAAASTFAAAMPAGDGMGNAHHQRQYEQADLQNVLQEHGSWLNSGGKDGRRANFRNANLQGLDLSNAMLAEASLRGADLSGTNLSGADLRGADLSEALLATTNLQQANLGSAVLSRADLRTAYMAGADLQNADLSGALLMSANLAGLNLASATLQETDLQGAALSQANLQGANLRGALLAGADLSGANLADANCRDVSFDGASLDNAILTGTNLKNARMQGANLAGVDLAAAEETSAEHRQESLHAEKNQIQQEWERVKAYEEQVKNLQMQIQQREMHLQNERGTVERARRELSEQYDGMQHLIVMTHEVMERHRLHDRLFKYFGITWFVFTILAFVSVMMFIQAIEIEDLNWLSLSLVFGGCTLILGLFIATTVRSIKLSNNLKRLLDMYEKQFPKPNNPGQ